MSEDKISRQAGREVGRSMFTRQIVGTMSDAAGGTVLWTAGELADAVSHRVCGFPSVTHADLRLHPGQVVYKAITKHFSRMLNPSSPHYFPPFRRSSNRYYLSYYGQDLIDTTPDVEWKTRVGSRRMDAAWKEKVARGGDSRNTSLERRHLGTVLDATDWTCCGCGKQDIRPALSLWQPDLIQPAAHGGQPVLGNIASTCFPCNFYKGTKDYEYLWRHNNQRQSMWHEPRARAALEICLELEEQETE